MKIKALVECLDGAVLVGNPNQDISGVAPLPLQNEAPNLLFWCSAKNTDKLSGIKAGVVLCSKSLSQQNFVPGCNYILVENPRQAFQTVLSRFFPEKEELLGVSRTAVIHPSAVLHPTVAIGEHVVVEKDVIIGENSIVGHNSVIKRRTIIGKNVSIGCNTTIGGFGFGFEKGGDGRYAAIPHLGNVIIEDNVEVCNNTNIDRAVLGSTIIRKNAKIHSLVQLSHGVEIGENTLVIANAMVAGSASVGDNVWVAPSVSIMNHKIVGDNSFLGLGAVVLNDVEKGAVVAGNPGKVLRHISSPEGRTARD